MAEGVGLREFGRMLGVSGEAIRKAIKTGRIPAHLVGERELSSGRRVPIISDVDSARLAFAGNTDPVLRQDGARISAGKKAATAERHLPTPSDASPPAPAQPADSAVLPSITESRQITEAYKARLTRLEYEEKSGKLVDAEEFRTKFTTMVATARTRLLGVPSKAKGRIPHLTVDEISVLTNLIRDALEEAAGAR